MAFTSDPAVLLIWRLVKERHAGNAFDGEGARIYGGRWNSPGRRLVYTSGSLALAALETLVHLDAAMPLPRFVAFPAQLSSTDIDPASLPAAYAVSGALPDLMTTRRVGDQWLEEGRYLALAVPSAIVPQESNLLLNSLHPRFTNLMIGAPVTFAVDARLRR